MDFRAEKPEDIAAVHRLHSAAFGRPNEADLVDRLRGEPSTLSWVAIAAGQVVGHVFFSPVTLVSAIPFPGLILGLAPVAVLPSHQRQGVGSLLIQQGLQACIPLGSKAVVVLGAPNYYARFGFLPAQIKGFTCEYPVPDEVFRILELEAGILEGYRGLIRYHPAFKSCE